jgi:hypothetical protein
MSNEVTSGQQKIFNDRSARDTRRYGYRINVEKPRRGLYSEDAIQGAKSKP